MLSARCRGRRGAAPCLLALSAHPAIHSQIHYKNGTRQGREAVHALQGAPRGGSLSSCTGRPPCNPLTNTHKTGTRQGWEVVRALQGSPRGGSLYPCTGSRHALSPSILLVFAEAPPKPKLAKFARVPLGAQRTSQGLGFGGAEAAAPPSFSASATEQGRCV